MTDEQPTEVAPTSQGDARGYSWEPFKPGHELSTKHGGYAPRRVNPLAAEVVELLLADDAVSYLREPRYSAAVWSWARTVSTVQLIDEWVDTMPISAAAESDRGKTSPLELQRRWHATLQTQNARLGLDPLSAARLGKDVAAARVDMAKLLTDERARQERVISHD